MKLLDRANLERLERSASFARTQDERRPNRSCLPAEPAHSERVEPLNGLDVLNAILSVASSLMPVLNAGDFHADRKRGSGAAMLNHLRLRPLTIVNYSCLTL